MGTVVVFTILCILVAAVFRFRHKRKKAGKSGCGCDCPGCLGTCGK